MFKELIEENNKKSRSLEEQMKEASQTLADAATVDEAKLQLSILKELSESYKKNEEEFVLLKRCQNLPATKAPVATTTSGTVTPGVKKIGLT